jgi:ADP-ribose pyrophosphatase YjhB (NUDIX family)
MALLKDGLLPHPSPLLLGVGVHKMRHLIRSRAIITRDDSILLIQSNSDLGLRWSTPGDRFYGAETWAESANQETFVKTEIEIGPLTYLYEMVTPENDTLHFHAPSKTLNAKGDMRMANRSDPKYNARKSGGHFVDCDEISNSQIWPHRATERV